LHWSKDCKLGIFRFAAQNLTKDPGSMASVVLNFARPVPEDQLEWKLGYFQSFFCWKLSVF